MSLFEQHFGTTRTVHEAVIGAVSDAPRPAAVIVAEVTASTGAAAGTVAAQLREMVADGILLRPARGMYCFNLELLTPEAREALGAGW